MTANKTQTRLVEVAGVPFGGPEFTVIAGPCSIESREQFLKTAQAVKAGGASLLRGGIWKLRTSSKTFQGLGPGAFQIVKDVLLESGMKLVSEITDPRQIEQIDEFVEMYQVGARNMHNYALLKELGQSKKPVMLKRGFAALVDEWLKAAEYITAGGNPNVILCERGIRTFETATRNTLDLNAVAFAKAHSDFPVIVDPSHGVGFSHLVPQMAWAAAAAGADGLMVEVHPDPKEAKSDGQQALTIEDFNSMMARLKQILHAVDRPLHTLKKP
jgi:3-deoxy-7-phosphoheptulonate synthase